MNLKVCGMKSPGNMREVAALLPDYMGFIFWKPSARYFEGDLPDLPGSIQKVGVFVDATASEILEKIEKYSLDLVQLHGSESALFCETLKNDARRMTNDLRAVKIIKAFSISHDFDFVILAEYEQACDYFLFDTKGKKPGGNGAIFDWALLRNYVGKKPIFLSGGIAPVSVQALKSLDFPIFAIDINSQFETEPGIKNASAIARFKNELQ